MAGKRQKKTSRRIAAANRAIGGSTKSAKKVRKTRTKNGFFGSLGF